MVAYDPSPFFRTGPTRLVTCVDRFGDNPNPAKLFADLEEEGLVDGCPTGLWIETNPSQGEFFCRPEAVAAIRQRAAAAHFVVAFGPTRPAYTEPPKYRVRYVEAPADTGTPHPLLGLLEADSVKIKVTAELRRLESEYSTKLEPTTELRLTHSPFVNDAWCDFPPGATVVRREGDGAETRLNGAAFTQTCPLVHSPWTTHTAIFPTPHASFSMTLYRPDVREQLDREE